MVGAVLNTLHPLLIDSTNMYPTPRLMPGSVLEAGVAPRQFHVWHTFMKSVCLTFATTCVICPIIQIRKTGTKRRRNLLAKVVPPRRAPRHVIQAFLQLSAPWALLFKPHYEGRLCAAGSRMCLSFSITNKRLTLYRSYRGEVSENWLTWPTLGSRTV